MFATTQMMGLDLAFPDVCRTPPVGVPIPYPNMGFPPMAVGAAYNILNFFAPAHHVGTTTPVTLADNLGLLGGMMSQTDMASSRRVTGAFTILVDGLPATRMTSVGPQNLINTVGFSIVPSQLNVLYLAP